MTYSDVIPFYMTYSDVIPLIAIVFFHNQSFLGPDYLISKITSTRSPFHVIGHCIIYEMDYLEMD